MNFEAIKTGFMNYLEDKLGVDKINGNGSQAQKQSQVIPDSEISIFLYSNEFKDYLISEVGADASIFTKSIDDILAMDIENGKLVEPEKNADTFGSNTETITSEKVNMSVPIKAPSNANVGTNACSKYNSNSTNRNWKQNAPNGTTRQ